jgi:hypothetical protein
MPEHPKGDDIDTAIAAPIVISDLGDSSGE